MSFIPVSKSLIIFLIFLLPIVAHSQTPFDSAIEYAHDDFLNTVRKEKSFGISYVSNIEPVTLITSFTNDDQKNLVVIFDSHSLKVGIGIIYVFRFDGKVHLIYKKEAFSVSAKIVTWNKHNALLTLLGSFNDGITNEDADILVYKNPQFISVLHIPYSSCSQAGYWRNSQVISSTIDQIQIIEYLNDLEYEAGKPTCTKATLQNYSWDEKTFTFSKVNDQPLTKGDLDDILKKNNLVFPDDLRDVCGSDAPEP